MASQISRRALLAGGLGALGVGYLAKYFWPAEDKNQVSFQSVLTSYEDLMGCHFTRPDQTPLDNPMPQVVTIPPFPGMWAIWGATGRDASGHIWFGVSAQGLAQPSAHLFEYNPISETVQDRGNVVDELRRLGLLRSGEGQMKIHTRIVQGIDGHLYFGSMDEQGENVNGSQLPTWGSHLWRLRLPDCQWEHLKAAPEGIIATATSGRWIYWLGYFHHVLYQLDCHTGETNTVTVGAEGGHISRNFFCDENGHVFVPRLSQDNGRLTTHLVEFDAHLNELKATPIENYTQTTDDNSHGITGFQPLADRTIIFTTDQGYLYGVDPTVGPPALVYDLGYLHPRGQAYVASLFTSDGRTHLMGLGRRKEPGATLEWLVHDLASHTTKAYPFVIRAGAGRIIRDATLYGSIARDNLGGCYVAGVYSDSGPAQPLLVQIN